MWTELYCIGPSYGFQQPAGKGSLTSKYASYEPMSDPSALTIHLRSHRTQSHGGSTRRFSARASRNLRRGRRIRARRQLGNVQLGFAGGDGGWMRGHAHGVKGADAVPISLGRARIGPTRIGPTHIHLDRILHWPLKQEKWMDKAIYGHMIDRSPVGFSLFWPYPHVKRMEPPWQRYRGLISLNKNAESWID